MGPTPPTPNITDLILNLVSNSLCTLLHLVRPKIGNENTSHNPITFAASHPSPDDHGQHPPSIFSSSCTPRSQKIRINSMLRHERDSDNVQSSEHCWCTPLPTNAIMGIGHLDHPMKRDFDSSTGTTSHLQLLVARGMSCFP
jgi:hypothetical protein